MPANPVKIGPFAGGLNQYSEPSAVGDNECIDIQNFDIDLDGSLVSRPPMIIKDDQSKFPPTGLAKPLGWFIDVDGERYLICSLGSWTVARKESTGEYITITTTTSAAAFVQYANRAYVVSPPSKVNPGGYWTPAGGFTAVGAMPKGTSAIVYKERLFIAGGREDATNANRVFFSNAADFATWNTSTNFFDVRSGDGQHIVKLIVFQDTIIVFKEDSTYAFSYDSNPARGAVRSINNAIGIGGPYCVVEYENSLYVYHESKVYQISNWTFTMINLKVPFEKLILFSVIQDVTLSILFDRLILRYFDNVYVFGLRTGAWTKWSVGPRQCFDYWVEVPIADVGEDRQFVAFTRVGNAGNTNRNLLKFTNTWNAVDAETATIDCYVVTKQYDFAVPYTYKRLFWWGVDAMSKNNLTYIVHPVTYTKTTTHAMMSAYAHNQITGTYAQPLDVSIDVSNSLTVGNSSGSRLFFKLLKSLRFRQINFRVGGSTTGKTTDGPYRIYSITAFVDNKEQVVRDIN